MSSKALRSLVKSGATTRETSISIDVKCRTSSKEKRKKLSVKLVMKAREEAGMAAIVIEEAITSGNLVHQGAAAETIVEPAVAPAMIIEGTTIIEAAKAADIIVHLVVIEGDIDKRNHQLKLRVNIINFYLRFIT